MLRDMLMLSPCNAWRLQQPSSVSALLGGKRARHLIAVKLGDIKLTAFKALVDGKVVLMVVLMVSSGDNVHSAPMCNVRLEL